MMGTTHTSTRGPKSWSAMLDARALAAMFTTLLAMRQTISASCTSSMSHWNVERRKGRRS